MDEIVCKGCTNEQCPYAGHAVRTMICPFEYKPRKQTNADKYFRNATDEELADWCYEHQEDCLGCPALRKGCMNFGKACKDAWLNWLKQEVESDG